MNRRDFLLTATAAVAGGECFPAAGAAALQPQLDAAQPGDVVVVPVGRHTGNLVMRRGVTLRGQSRAGSVVVGRIDCDRQPYAVIENLTIDVAGIAMDGITSGAMTSGGMLHQAFRQLDIIGSGLGNGYHAILCQAGDGITAHDIRAMRFSHGVALRCSHASATNIYAEDCNSSSVIVKAAIGSGNVRNVLVSNVQVRGTWKNYGGAVIVVSYDDNTICESVIVSSVIGYNANPAAVYTWQRRGICRQVKVCGATNSTGVNFINNAAAVEQAGVASF